MIHCLGLVFANINNSTMDLFTSFRSMGALPFGGRYRLIDFTLSNLVNGGIVTVGLPVREKYQSLLDHIGKAREWDLDRKTAGLTFLPPFFIDSGLPYNTKMKALLGSCSYIETNAADYILLCEPDTVMNIDLGAFLHEHIASGADITYSTVRSDSPNRRGTFTFGFRKDVQGQVTAISDVVSEPDLPELGTGICVMKRQVLDDLLVLGRNFSGYDFDSELVNRHLSALTVRTLPFTGYIAKIRTVQDYFGAGMDVLDSEIRRDVFYSHGHIFTKTHSDVPVLYGLNSVVSSSLVADGSSVEGKVEHSILFRRVKLGKGSDVASSIIMQDSVIEDGAVLRYCIADKKVRVKAGAHIIGTPEKPRLLAKGQTYSE